LQYLWESNHIMGNALLLTYNLANIVNFPTRIQNNSRSIIDNILLSRLKFCGITGKAFLKNPTLRVIICDTELNHYTFSCWGKVEHGVPQGSTVGPLFFLLYVNDSLMIINNKSKTILFADDSSLILTNPNPVDFKNYISTFLEHINIWFKGNLLSLNFNKTNFIHFITKEIILLTINLGYSNNQIAHIASTELLGIVIKNSLSWKLHIEQITSKLSAACYAIRSVKQHISRDTLKMVYYSYFPSVLLFMGELFT